MAAIFVKQWLFWSTDPMFEKKFAQRKPFSIEGCSFHCCNRSTLAHICSHLMSALRRSVSALWNTKGRFMIFFWKTKIFEMFMAYLRMDGSGNGLHCFNRRTCRHTWYKGIFRETLSIARAAILLKKVSIFLGDPPLGKYFLYFFPDHLEGRGFHQSMPRYFAQIKVKGSKALRPTVWPPGGAAVEISDFFPTPPMFEGP